MRGEDSSRSHRATVSDLVELRMAGFAIGALRPNGLAGERQEKGCDRKDVIMSCEFCQRAIEVVEDYIYHDGLVFHPQQPTENNIRCSPTVREFEEVIVPKKPPEVCHEL